MALAEPRVPAPRAMPPVQTAKEVTDERGPSAARAARDRRRTTSQTSEPVGSKALLERHHLGVSAATVRNDMAALEEEGLIAAPHTSAGRVPTDAGYRLFVDRLWPVKPMSAAERAPSPSSSRAPSTSTTSSTAPCACSPR